MFAAMERATSGAMPRERPCLMCLDRGPSDYRQTYSLWNKMPEAPGMTASARSRHSPWGLRTTATSHFVSFHSRSSRRRTDVNECLKLGSA